MCPSASSQVSRVLPFSEMIASPGFTRRPQRVPHQRVQRLARRMHQADDIGGLDFAALLTVLGKLVSVERLQPRRPSFLQAIRDGLAERRELVGQPDRRFIRPKDDLRRILRDQSRAFDRRSVGRQNKDHLGRRPQMLFLTQPHRFL